MKQQAARNRGLKAHAEYFEESRRIAAASAAKGRCFIATLALGECADTRAFRALRAFRDLYLRRCACGRWFIASYYRYSPTLCDWLATRPYAMAPIRWLLKSLARAAGVLVHWKLGQYS